LQINGGVFGIFIDRKGDQNQSVQQDVRKHLWKKKRELLYMCNDWTSFVKQVVDAEFDTTLH